MPTVYLSLGSNVGDRAAHLRAAIAALPPAGVRVKHLSSIYETEPVDFLDQPWFLNCVAEAETETKGRDAEAPQPKQSAAPRIIPHALENLFVHPRMLLPQFPCVTADEANTLRIRSGRSVNLPELSRARQVKVFSGQKNLIAIATRVAGTLFHPRIVLQAD